MSTPVHVPLRDLADAVGSVLGPGPWRQVDQQRIDTFADATDDHQWIHTDPERAAAGPFGATVAHGYLTLSLVPTLLGALVVVDGAAMGVNYGLDRVRFPAPVTAGSRVRASAVLAEVQPVGGGVQARFDVTIEVEHGAKPACIATVLCRFYGAEVSA
ncbi:acyl dehydratase [Nocardioides zeae]|uniref:Acyl dehydratase n=1 Tax=Nocardioides zeae TaxID=1457234 RepID=A0ACC6IJ24_9ACTN|nr:MaoC family dehydratase [Nocardioides zeae]MDR6174682.1 acyl dehydratase [Nocardioides zeae]MDR6210751.1 acyl dehydratase [Nocardioides zeae]